MDTTGTRDPHRAYPPLELYPGVSRRLLILVALTSMLTLAVILALPLGWLTLPLVLVVLLGAWLTLWAEVLGRAPWSIRSATWHPDGFWTLRLVSGREIQARLLSETFVSSWMVSLIFSVEGARWQRRTLALAPDSLDPETLRRLRQRLRLSGASVERL
ncbi:MAG: protein YgfX [Thermochromatium sp.]